MSHFASFDLYRNCRYAFITTENSGQTWSRAGTASITKTLYYTAKNLKLFAYFFIVFFQKQKYFRALWEVNYQPTEAEPEMFHTWNMPATPY